MRPRALTWLALGVGAAAAAHHWFDVVEVRGRSMWPTLIPGDRLLVVRARPRLGDIVLAPDPRDPERELIKRVSALESGTAVLRGDNVSASSVARVPIDVPQWRAVLMYWPASRVRTVTRPTRRFVGRT